ncbi:MAG: hypothetical protein HQM11_02840 [SAR324 cluster bacterium]|nr:hypothetical protein [SAR324 cluster bacterium]
MHLNINPVFEALRNQGRHVLAAVLEQKSLMPIQEYSHELYEYPASVEVESFLKEAFTDELREMAWTHAQVDEIVESFIRLRVLQTATHVTATEGPTFWAIHHLSTLGFPEGEYYGIGAFSGVPFSGSAWSGCLNYSKRHQLEDIIQKPSSIYRELEKSQKNRMQDTADARISLIPGKMRDVSVFHALIPERTSHILACANPVLQKLAPVPETGTLFSRWSLDFCQQQMNLLMPDKPMVFFDINQVIRRYLLKILVLENHPVTRIFTDQALRKNLLNAFAQDIPMFSAPSGNCSKQIFWKLGESCLYSPEGTEPLDLSMIYENLEKENWCPAIFPTFIVLAFLNGWKCLGSFEQIEYLTRFKNRLQTLNWLNQEQIKNVETQGLTTGRCVDAQGIPVYPLDVLLGTSWEFNKKQTLFSLIEPLMPRLLKE